MNKTINLCLFIIVMYVLGVLIAREFADKKVWEYTLQHPTSVDPLNPPPCKKNIIDYVPTLPEATFLIKSLDEEKGSLEARYASAR
jgi:hypothetical protein